MDRPIHRSKWYYIKKRFLRPGHLIVIGAIALILILQQIFKEAPPRNAIRQISYRRNKVIVYLDSESVETPPIFQFAQLSDSTCALDIADSRLRYEWEQTFDYGDVESIHRKSLHKDTARIVVHFNTLKDVPTVAYLDDPPRFKIHFNRYLDSLFIIVLDPGHGGDNTGAQGRAGTIEKHLMLNIGLKLEEHLKPHPDIRVFLTRRNDGNVSLYSRRQLSNFWEADLFVSIHANSAPNRRANHSEVYYASPRSQSVARIFLRDLEALLNNGRGLVRRRGFAVIRGNAARLGAVLVETVYLSNKQGEAYLRQRKNQDAIARTIYGSILKVIDQNR